ncbi:MAG: Nif3-like dinuclear metal center hexameric protein [Planctomycetota bacterium]
MSVRLAEICDALGRLAPLRLAEEWDNVGLLLGDRSAHTDRVMTCLTLSPDVAAEAIEQRAGLVVTHHPIPFRPLAKLTTDSITGTVIWRLARAGIAVYSAHTAMDSAACGINQRWADSLGLTSIAPLRPFADQSESDSESKSDGESRTDSGSRTDGKTGIGAGRYGRIDAGITLQELAVAAGKIAGVKSARWVGSGDKTCRKIAVACGSGGSFLAASRRCGCDVLVTGEATFHACLEARSEEIGLILVGHYGSERFAMEHLAEHLSEQFAGLDVWASRCECDPLVSVSFG